ncbi:dATP/dGTP pyrophosphohydrolase domain-containing protein [Stenotrophomonas sp.]|uniref:dATP/dGTP pyrophosphohydrolase domain-containing protein n=1 Tax=Stenotrophomonas sp. TaxID=69392 RepID=UPI0028ADE318|nr:dATP/dGTP pyrophosphohydrolase domain-containing protein [Stenotrophomonas sp.]
MIDSNPTACTCPSGDGSLRHPCQVHNANYVGDAAPFDLVAHLERQRYFSAHTFGPGTRAAGIVDHIRKELLEIEADPGDLREWVDVIILAFDGAWRSGATAQEIISAIVVKQTKNEGRTWPHWSTMPADKAIEHDRSGESAAAPEAVAYNAGGIELTACQLHEALLMAGSPELDVEFDDRSRVRIFHTDNGHSGPGLYCECVDVEEEGCILLDGTSPAIAAPIAAAPVEGGQITGWRNVDGMAVFAVASHSGITPNQEFVRYDDHLNSLASTPAAPGIDLAPRPMATAPRDGTMLRLLVQFDDHATEDTEGPAWTIGACNDDNVHQDERAGWQFAGWCWDHDHFTEGKGTPVGWLPLIDASPEGGSTDENNDLLPELRDVEDYFTSVDPNPIHLATVRQAISAIVGSPKGGSETEPMFYIQDTRSFVGNCPMWWAPNGAGYVTRLDEAGRFTEQEAIRQNRSRETDVPWPCAEIDKLGRITVDMQHMRPRSERLAELQATSAEVGGVSAFKTGDRVRIIATDYDTSEDANLANGQTGRVIKSLGGAASIQTDAGPRHVNDDGDGWWFFDSQLELAGDDEQPTSHGAGAWLK